MKELLAIMLFWMAPQTPGASFDVASVKSNNANNGIVSIGSDPGGRFTASGMTLKALIANAYRIREFQIAGGPAWIGTDRFDIEAKANWDAATKLPADRQALMLQNLLAERFQLKLHNERKEMPVYDLIVAKGGIKMEATAEPPKPAPDAPPQRPPAPGAMPAPGSFSMGFGMMNGSAVQLSRLAENLGPQVSRVIIDKTGLAGYYNISLKWVPDALKDRLPEGSGPVMVNGISIDPNGPSLFTAIQEQLGLKLEPSRGLVDTWVIDSVQKLSANPGQ